MMSLSTSASYYYQNKRIVLNSPLHMPKAGSFLWNKSMLLQINCRGYAIAQFMQPEPAKYSHAPIIEATTFIQPEHSYYSHHPGRFFYIRDNETGNFFSAPYEPVRSPLDQFRFSVGTSDIQWYVESLGISVQIKLTLAINAPHELWQITLQNTSNKVKNISFFPYFSIGYMSWMNQSATFDSTLNSIVAKSVTPYQKLDDYAKQQHFKDNTFLLSNSTPIAWTANQSLFEGEGGLHNPSALQHPLLKKNDADYEIPVAALQYDVTLKPVQSHGYRFVFGATKDNNEIKKAKDHYFKHTTAFKNIQQDYLNYINQEEGCLHINTPDNVFDNFVNQWLPRQIFYHGDINRLCTDPQTRNYLQDNMGMCYINPDIARTAFLTALSQQHSNGAMPDGILLHPQAQLKYINTVPHTDHGVWLPICLSAYLDETDDISLLNESVAFADSSLKSTVYQHIELAIDYLISARDKRGLSYIDQGDWCDPMNMVGHKGHGISSWLSLATAYAIQQWLDISHSLMSKQRREHLTDMFRQINHAVNTHCWDGNWYARGITDDNVLFGVKKDQEGSIYLNPQSWSILSGAADSTAIDKMLVHINKLLATPFGIMILAPSYTHMRTDIGRLTQKYPGTAENGSIYNHAGIFYAYSLYKCNNNQQAFDVLRKMIPDQNDAEQRGQLPLFIPNYYRGAYFQRPKTAGRSSHLFNTGTVAWYYRCLIDGLFGVQGKQGKLLFSPNLPSHWPKVQIRRKFAGATFDIKIKKQHTITKIQVWIDNRRLSSAYIDNIIKGQYYNVTVLIPHNEI